MLNPTLSCDDVRARIPGLVTGEKATPEEREHLARCDACREERNRQAKHADRVREGLTSLAPSPLLEDALLDLATEATEERPRRPWIHIGAAAFAAAALLLVVVLPRLDLGGSTDVVEQGEAGEDGHGVEEGPLGRAAVGFVPTAAEVSAARRHSVFSLDGTIAKEPEPFPAGPAEAVLLDAMKHHIWVDAGGKASSVNATEFLPPPPEAVHRYVYRDPAGEVLRRQVGEPPYGTEPGLVVLGAAFLASTGATLEGGGRAPAVVEGKRRWPLSRSTPRQAELTLASPDAGGASARVRVEVRPDYAGTLLLEGPLARALDLHYFEIPGEVVFGNRSQRRGIRARARVRIPELGVDRIVEVQIVEPRRAKHPPGGGPGPSGIRLAGPLPSMALCGRARELVGSPAFWAMQIEEVRTEDLASFDPGDGPFRATLIHGVDVSKLPRIPDLPVLGELFRDQMDGVTDLVPRPVDVLRGVVHTFTIETLELGGRWEPGAQATIARAWRGTQARPSAEGVASAKVGADGRLVLHRIRGEPGKTLRMLVTAKDGTSAFHEVIVAPELLVEPRLPIEVRADGTVVVIHTGAGESFLIRHSEAEASDQALKTALLAHAANPQMRDEARNSRWTVDLRVEKAASWRLVQWVLQCCADPDVRIRRFRLVPMDAPADPLPIVLPVDPGLGAAQPASAGLRVTLTRAASGAPLQVRVQDLGSGGGEVLWRPDQLDLALGDAIVAVAGERTGLTVEIAVPPPGLVTAREVHRALEACREAGFAPEAVRLLGAPPR